VIKEFVPQENMTFGLV